MRRKRRFDALLNHRRETTVRRFTTPVLECLTRESPARRELSLVLPPLCDAPPTHSRSYIPAAHRPARHAKQFSLRCCLSKTLSMAVGHPALTLRSVGTARVARENSLLRAPKPASVCDARANPHSGQPSALALSTPGHRTPPLSWSCRTYRRTGPGRSRKTPTAPLSAAQMRRLTHTLQ